MCLFVCLFVRLFVCFPVGVVWRVPGEGWGVGEQLAPPGQKEDRRVCEAEVQEGSEEVSNQKNTGRTSVDRSTKATLSTYNTWIQISRLRKVYHIQSLKLRLATEPLTVDVVRMQQGRDLMLVM